MAEQQGSDKRNNQIGGVTIGNVYGGIRNAIIAGRDVIFPGSGEEQRALRNRRNMLNLVWNTWIEGVLMQSLHNEMLIELGKETRPDAVARPWDMLHQMPDREPKPVASGTTMLDLFDQTNGALFIYGKPGSGKTTMLLELCRLLIIKARDDPSAPIPIIFNLSSWKPIRRKKPDEAFADWLVNELRDLYFIPNKVGRSWVEYDELLLLLDGLDEVSMENRETCVEAINHFRKEHNIPLTICSRIQEYEALTIKLNLRGAVLIQPLTNQQVSEYIRSAGTDFAKVLKVVQQDPELQEFTRTPLILSVLLLAYHNMTEADLRALQGAGDYRKHVFNTYIAKMFNRRAVNQDYPPDQIQFWLSWLAQEMVNRGITLLTIEDIQPNWLPFSKSIRRLFFGMFYGLIFGLIGGPIFGLIGGLIGWLIGGQIEIKPIDKFVWSWKNARGLGLIFGIIGGVIGGLLGGLFVMLIGALPRLGGVSWSDVLIGGVIGGLSLGTIGGLSFGIMGGLSGHTLEDRSHPGEGITASLKNFFVGFLFYGLILGLIFGLIYGLIVAISYQSLSFGLLKGLRFALIVQMVVGLKFGGNFLIAHFITRWLLTNSGNIPWKLNDFLEYCTERIFLRRVGGGYIFIHRMLMEHFAEMDVSTLEKD
jgi:energy-coupling factor transporter ATP-binding protein EcfA2